MKKLFIFISLLLLLPVSGYTQPAIPGGEIAKASSNETSLTSTRFNHLKGVTSHHNDSENIIRAQAPIAKPHSDVFGANIFNGSFSRDSFSSFNPNHTIGIGDKITLKLWGAFELDTLLTVDAQGNIFVPKIGPVSVIGVKNSELGNVVNQGLKRIYKANVSSYVSLAAAQPVKVFVTGFVSQPGMYSGLSSDSVLFYLDQAGGIDSKRGSFIDVTIKRGGHIKTTINLYHFLLAGEIPDIQFSDGDIILIGKRNHTVKVNGLVQNSNLFEFRDPVISLSRILKTARIKPSSTHVRVVRNSGSKRNVDYFAIDAIRNVLLNDGDEVFVVADKKPGTITVRLEGEHDSPQEYILPYGATMGTLLASIRYTQSSNPESIQLFRESVKKRQKIMLDTSLQSLQSSVLTARSATNEEAALRQREAELVLEWIERAKSIEPRGQVVIANASNLNDLRLENGDVVRIPAKSSLVLVHGEVLFPNAVVFSEAASLEDYISNSGGYTQGANTALVIVLHPDGSFQRAKSKLWSKKLTAAINPGDEILVLPKINLKKLQVTKDIAQVMYQIALSAAVVIAL